MAGAKLDIAVLTHFPSPYQVELFNAVAANAGANLRVWYLHERTKSRHWEGRAVAHESLFISNAAAKDRALRDLESAELVIFNYYNDAFAQQLLERRATSGGAWAFWGERPRTHAASGLARLYRRWKLRRLHNSFAPIWGIGGMAVAAYQDEFGATRQYANLPYFSNLDRFAQCSGRQDRRSSNERVFLFSGALIKRKAVDLVAAAFVRLSAELPYLRLALLGCGPLEASLRKQLNQCAAQVDILGFRDWGDLPATYSRADVLCVPSRYDGWGMVIPEGLASGLPVISTHQTGAAVEFLENGRNGWLIPGNDFIALYNAMRNAATMDQTALASMACQARSSICRHSLSDGVERFLQSARLAIGDWPQHRTAPTLQQIA